MLIVKHLIHFRPSTCVNKNMNKIFSGLNSTDLEQYYESFHRRHPDYEKIMASIHNKAMKDCVKDRINAILVLTTLKHK